MTTCTHPKTAWYKRNSGEKLRFTLPTAKEINQFDKIPLPCGKCDKCQASYANSWAVRCAMEMRMHEQNTYITLTYDHIDSDNPTLKPDDVTKFIKRLRNYVAKHSPQELYPDENGEPELMDKKIRYMQCGEYGDKYHRPHHHAIIFGYDFPDKIKTHSSSSGSPMWNSEILTKIWGHGLCVIGEANMATATYIASYIGKKIYGCKDNTGEYISGGSKNSHYNKTDKETGEIHTIHKEYMTMSRMNGLGHSFFEKYQSDMFPSGTIHLPIGKQGLGEFPVPDYFYRKLAEINPPLFLESQRIRQQKGIEYDLRQPLEKTPERARTKAYILRKNQVEKGRPLDGINPSYHVNMTDIDEKQTSDKKYQERLLEQEQFEAKNKHLLQGIDNR